MKYTLTALTLAVAATALPTAKTFRADEMCGQWETATAGPYTIYNNLWGQDSATSGQQCTTIDSITDDELAWHTAWSWAGGEYEVKSYANVVPTITPKKISALSSIPATWDWRYVYSKVRNRNYELIDIIATREATWSRTLPSTPSSAPPPKEMPSTKS